MTTSKPITSHNAIYSAVVEIFRQMMQAFRATERSGVSDVRDNEPLIKWDDLMVQDLRGVGIQITKLTHISIQISPVSSKENHIQSLFSTPDSNDKSTNSNGKLSNDWTFDSSSEDENIDIFDESSDRVTGKRKYLDSNYDINSESVFCGAGSISRSIKASMEYPKNPPLFPPRSISSQLKISFKNSANHSTNLFFAPKHQARTQNLNGQAITNSNATNTVRSDFVSESQVINIFCREDY